MKITRPKVLFIPALSIVIVVVLLLVMISVSTFQNLDRDREKALEFVHRQGLLLIQTLEAGIRAGLVGRDLSDQVIERLIRETADGEDVAYVYILDGTGKMIIRSDQPGTDDESARTWPEEITGGFEATLSRMRTRPDRVQVYELAKRFTPTSPHAASNSRMPGSLAPEDGDEYGDTIIVTALKMQAFEEARQTDLHHAVIMAAIVLALGSGAIFFIFVIQNYYLVNRTLKQTRDYTRLVVENMANGLLSIDRAGRVLSFNRPAMEMLGLEERHLQAADLREIIDFQESGIDDILNRCTAVLEKEIHFKTRSGPADKIVPLAITATPILGEGSDCRGAVLVLRDLTQIKQLEARVRRTEQLAAVGRMAAVVAHEVRNPLSSIKGFAQFLRQALNERPKEREYADIMIKEVDRINRVVTDLLVIARPLEAERQPTDVKALLVHTVTLIQADADSRGIAVQVDCPGQPGTFSLDGNQMNSALLNLLLNALQAVETAGYICIGGAVDDQKSVLHLWVLDSGPGIAADDHKKIFEPFFTTREKGTGLGLAIVQKILDNHGGLIQVQSPVGNTGRGCRFDLFIPKEEQAVSMEKWS